MSGESVALPQRLFLVSYRLIGEYGVEIGHGTTRITASYPDSVITQVNRILSGRLHKVTEVIPIT